MWLRGEQFLRNFFIGRKKQINSNLQLPRQTLLLFPVSILNQICPGTLDPRASERAGNRNKVTRGKGGEGGKGGGGGGNSSRVMSGRDKREAIHSTNQVSYLISVALTIFHRDISDRFFARLPI